MKKCLKCDNEITNEDNFCFQCGHLTSTGYMYLEKPENIEKINGCVRKKHERMSGLFVIVSICFILFSVIITLRGQDLLRPYAHLRKEWFYQQYGFRTTLIDTERQYNNIKVNSLEEAKELIRKDLYTQKWKCYSNIERGIIEHDLKTRHNIVDVNFCDISIEKVEKLKNVIDSVFGSFPNVSEYLTNITISNPSGLTDYIAKLQPIYQFVNNNQNIMNFNQVNKTQILLSSYYFLNDEAMNQSLFDSYPKGASWESIIAHELGHYLLFVALLKENEIDNIMFITEENYSNFNKILQLSDSGDLANRIVMEALANYNSKHKNKIDLEVFVSDISKYAGSKNSNGIIMFEETIAEAVHDYYINRNNASKSSLEIINVLKFRLR